MSVSQESGIVSLASRVLIMAMLIGGAALALFKWLFVEVVITEVLTLIALLSLVAAAALNVVWMRWRKHVRGTQ